jgi:hypothetical protein
MKDISECIGKIDRSRSTIFSTINLTSGFWQMLLQPKSHQYIAFTISGMGQFQLCRNADRAVGKPGKFLMPNGDSCRRPCQHHHVH